MHSSLLQSFSTPLAGLPMTTQQATLSTIMQLAKGMAMVSIPA
jgi:hypothetical protein